MPTPKPRTPICIARGNIADLEASKADIEEGEICYAFDLNSHFMMVSGNLIRVESLPDGSEYDILQVQNGEWVGSDQINGGNF